MDFRDGEPGAEDSHSSGDTSENARPSISFSYRCDDLACDFDASASEAADPDGRIASYAWDFGDGWSATGVTTRHLYLSSGSYPVQLVVTDERSARDSLRVSLDVQVPAVPRPEGKGIWIGDAELASLPMSGPAWNRLLEEADGSCGTLELSDQEQDHNVCIMAKALAHVRTDAPGTSCTWTARFPTISDGAGRSPRIRRPRTTSGKPCRDSSSRP